MEKEEVEEVKEVDEVKERSCSVSGNWYDQEGCTPLFLRKRAHTPEDAADTCDTENERVRK